MLSARRGRVGLQPGCLFQENPAPYHLGFRVQGVGFRVTGLGFRVSGFGGLGVLGSRVYEFGGLAGWGFRAEGLGSRGLGFGVVRLGVMGSWASGGVDSPNTVIPGV